MTTGMSVDKDSLRGTHAPAQPNDRVEAPRLRFENVSKSFVTSDGLRVAIKDVDLEIEPGTIMCLLGPSGCGKSTLLNMAAGLMVPSGGRVAIRDRQVEPGAAQSGVGYITQAPNLMPWRTVERNVAIGLEIEGVPRDRRRRLVQESLALVGLEGAGGLYPGQLSGGMQSRVSLARTLIRGPKLLLMDEPFAALDAQLRMRMQDELVRILSTQDQTILFVTHDIDEAIVIADQIAVFSPGPAARIECVIDNALPRPRNPEMTRTHPDAAELWRKLWRQLEGPDKSGRRGVE